jgi:mannose-6-phosphate isomerase-like protein (cupin superfamily)
MLETFTWSNDVVFSAPHATVIASIDPSWDAIGKFSDPGTVFGFVLDGDNAILRRRGTHPVSLPVGSYFSVKTGEGELSTPGGRLLLIYQREADFPFMVGGPIEQSGRFRYIDGCTDSMLIPPWRLGEACLNLLHIPSHVEQTMHTHPSDRIGVVVSGTGQCVTPEGVTDLVPGMLWRIPADGLHRFRTEGDSIRIVAWHPDSDTGPTDDDHAMLRRTLVNGVSATQLDDIRTRRA